MADIPNREELERLYGRKIGSILRQQMGDLLELMGDPPSMNNVPIDFWDKAGKDAEQILRPFGEQVYMESAQRMLESVPIGVDWGLVNEAAIDWGQQYTFELVKGINGTSRSLLQKAVGSYFAEPVTRGELEKRLLKTFGPVRSEMIAVTEVTRAAAEGERATVKDLEAQGIKMVEIWQTNNDELVCPICGPRHDKRAGTNWQSPQDGPPAHPRCRCWINHELPKVRGRKLKPKEGEK